jgi:5-methyltetrahydropteroyltriglutamate--homocysteine methyltransferase
MGAARELKFALESFWAGKTTEADLQATARTLRRHHWQLQKEAGIEHIPSNDFSFYDHVLDTVALVGAVPKRYGWNGDAVDLRTYFAMARGGQNQIAMEMTKWFDTNYHYIVPEFSAGQSFKLASTHAVDAFIEAKGLGIHTRPVLLGPVSFLLLGKMEGGGSPLSLLPGLLPIYENILQRLAGVGADWVQIDEPVLVLDLPTGAQAAFATAYDRLSRSSLKLLVATYFGGLHENLSTAVALPVAGLHIDLVRAPQQMDELLNRIPALMSLSLGVVDGRNIWKTDLAQAAGLIHRAVARLGSDRLLIAPSCSLLHSPADLDMETRLDTELRGWMSFAKQKLHEVSRLTRAVGAPDTFTDNQASVAARRASTRIHVAAVKQRTATTVPAMLRRGSSYPARKSAQDARLGLPSFPTTTIGSFPQTAEVRAARATFKAKNTTEADYTTFLKAETEKAIRFQEEVGLDVLVHGEFERNDMVEYFGEQLAGFAFTQNGWVQSYGSRCVKPPIIFGDVHRPTPMTIEWARYAQSLTTKPVKGMLTGPVTILKWSFVRDDQPLSETCQQIALAIRDEVVDLEAAGISIIQIDEPALREGLPLRRSDWKDYLKWAVDAFRLSTAGVRDDTQIHTHMCYAEFNDIIEAIGAMDADVISIETSRSQMALLSAFTQYRYPNGIGPGVYDIHSPRVPTRGEMETLLKKASAVLSADQLWVNPDCGLKTRGWAEVKPALASMVEAARLQRTGDSK